MWSLCFSLMGLSESPDQLQTAWRQSVAWSPIIVDLAITSENLEKLMFNMKTMDTALKLQPDPGRLQTILLIRIVKSHHISRNTYSRTTLVSCIYSHFSGWSMCSHLQVQDLISLIELMHQTPHGSHQKLIASLFFIGIMNFLGAGKFRKIKENKSQGGRVDEWGYSDEGSRKTGESQRRTLSKKNRGKGS